MADLVFQRIIESDAVVDATEITVKVSDSQRQSAVLVSTGSSMRLYFADKEQVSVAQVEWTDPHGPCLFTACVGAAREHASVIDGTGMLHILRFDRLTHTVRGTTALCDRASPAHPNSVRRSELCYRAVSVASCRVAPVDRADGWIRGVFAAGKPVVLQLHAARHISVVPFVLPGSGVSFALVDEVSAPGAPGRVLAGQTTEFAVAVHEARGLPTWNLAALEGECLSCKAVNAQSESSQVSLDVDVNIEFRYELADRRTISGTNATSHFCTMTGRCVLLAAARRGGGGLTPAAAEKWTVEIVETAHAISGYLPWWAAQDAGAVAALRDAGAVKPTAAWVAVNGSTAFITTFSAADTVARLTVAMPNLPSKTSRRCYTNTAASALWAWDGGVAWLRLGSGGTASAALHVFDTFGFPTASTVVPASGANPRGLATFTAPSGCVVLASRGGVRVVSSAVALRKVPTDNDDPLSDDLWQVRSGELRVTVSCDSTGFRFSSPATQCRLTVEPSAISVSVPQVSTAGATLAICAAAFCGETLAALASDGGLWLFKLVLDDAGTTVVITATCVARYTRRFQPPILRVVPIGRGGELDVVCFNVFDDCAAPIALAIAVRVAGGVSPASVGAPRYLYSGTETATAGVVSAAPVEFHAAASAWSWLCAPATGDPVLICERNATAGLPFRDGISIPFDAPYVAAVASTTVSAAWQRVLLESDAAGAVAAAFDAAGRGVLVHSRGGAVDAHAVVLEPPPSDKLVAVKFVSAGGALAVAVATASNHWTAYGVPPLDSLSARGIALAPVVSDFALIDRGVRAHKCHITTLTPVGGAGVMIAGCITGDRRGTVCALERSAGERELQLSDSHVCLDDGEFPIASAPVRTVAWTGKSHEAVDFAVVGTSRGRVLRVDAATCALEGVTVRTVAEVTLHAVARRVPGALSVPITALAALATFGPQALVMAATHDAIFVLRVGSATVDIMQGLSMRNVTSLDALPAPVMNGDGTLRYTVVAASASVSSRVVEVAATEDCWTCQPDAAGARRTGVSLRQIATDPSPESITAAVFIALDCGASGKRGDGLKASEQQSGQSCWALRLDGRRNLSTVRALAPKSKPAASRPDEAAAASAGAGGISPLTPADLGSPLPSTLSPPRTASLPGSPSSRSIAEEAPSHLGVPAVSFGAAMRLPWHVAGLHAGRASTATEWAMRAPGAPTAGGFFNPSRSLVPADLSASVNDDAAGLRVELNPFDRSAGLGRSLELVTPPRDDRSSAPAVLVGVYGAVAVVRRIPRPVADAYVLLQQLVRPALQRPLRRPSSQHDATWASLESFEAQRADYATGLRRARSTDVVREDVLAQLWMAAPDAVEGLTARMCADFPQFAESRAALLSALPCVALF